MNGEKSNLPLSLPSEVAAALASMGQALIALSSALQGNPSRSRQIATNVLPSFPDAATVAEATNELLRAKARADRCEGYIKTLRIALLSFAQSTQNAPLNEILPQQIERWLDTYHGSERTKRIGWKVFACFFRSP